MPASLSLNEIRARALAFARDWAVESRESAEKQTFWNEFFNVFGIHRRRTATFEVPVQLRDGRHGSIDLFWRGVLLVEHKSRGKDLTAAFQQAADYFEGIEEEDLPGHVIVSDFARIRVYDLGTREQTEFPLEKLHLNIGSFGFLTGHTPQRYAETPEVNVKAAQSMAALHEDLLRNGYAGHPLAVLLVRLMFCLFADHTGLFPRNQFRDIIERKTRLDGSDTGPMLAQVFSVLDTPAGERQRNLDPDLGNLPFVNGQIFHETHRPPAFDARARKTLLRCCAFDWSAVSPAIFGAMFQGVMDEEKGRRRKIGAHYTSERNIMKALGPLLLDPLREEVDRATTERSLNALLEKISGITILDPACGCGNFLIIAYRELRQLEIDIHRMLQRLGRTEGQRVLSVDFTRGISVEAMYGIEIEEFPCRVAEVALYLVDHLMNLKASEEFGENFIRLPLSKAPHITNGNALRLDWNDVIPPSRLTCIVGNPPFVGKAMRTPDQIEDMNAVFADRIRHAELDYVAAWYGKAARFLAGTSIPVAFVSTNSITQGEQVSILWPRLFEAGLRIQFAHRTFRWDNEAPGQAAVHCVIIGWLLAPPRECLLFEYETPQSESVGRRVDHINPYLIDAPDVFIHPRRRPLCDVPPIAFGSMPNDGGNLLLTNREKAELLEAEPRARPFIRRFLGSEEFINDIDRWCLWLADASPRDIRSMAPVMRRVEAVRKHRAASKRLATRKLASTPSLFGENRQPQSTYLLIPSVSSEQRTFVPMGFMRSSIIASNLVLTVADADLYHFGVLQSTMHMAWMRQVCGRLESRYRYSNEIVYNNFPWPTAPSEARQAAVRKAAQAVLDARAACRGQSLADLYDADVTPPELLKAHRQLDKAVDACYSTKNGFGTELARVRFLFKRHADLVHGEELPLLPQGSPPSRTRKRTG